MTTMIERVAKAMFLTDFPDDIWNGPSETSYMKAARAAITAMREPTEEMFTFSSFKSAYDLYRYQAMIDAALKEAP